MLIAGGTNDFDPLEDEPTLMVGLAELEAEFEAELATTVFSEEDRLSIMAWRQQPADEPTAERPADEQTVAWKRPAPSDESHALTTVRGYPRSTDPRVQTRTTSRKTPKRSRRRRSAIIATACAVAGMTVGASIGMAAMGGDTPRVTISMAPQTAAAAEPTPSAPAATEPAVAAAAAPTAPALTAVAEASPDESAVEAPVQAAVQAAAEAPVEVAPDPLVEAREAIGAGDLEAASEALAAARSTGADANTADRLEAELAVLRGDGELAISRLRTIAQAQQDGALWVALGRVLAQAERDPEATAAFTAALAIEPASAEAHIGMAHIMVHEADLSAAHRHLRQARAAVQALPEPNPQLAAQLESTAAAISFEEGHFSDASDQAARARALNTRSSEAALRLGRIAIERRQDPIAHLRAATQGEAPPPIALGLLAPLVERAEGCELAARYLQRAPEGFDAPAMRRLRRRCGGRS